MLMMGTRRSAVRMKKAILVLITSNLTMKSKKRRRLFETF